MSSKRPAVFFDRDNTLIANDGYLGDPSKVTLIGGASTAIARARRLGFVVMTISNQSGVARGMFGEDDVRAVNARMDQMLRAENAQAIIERHEFCPYHPKAAVESYRRESDLRKPNAGMLYAAAQAGSIDLTKSWVIGDAPRDIEAGHAAGCRTILFQDASLPESPASKERIKVMPETTVGSLIEAIDYIEKNPERPKPVSSMAPVPKKEVKVVAMPTTKPATPDVADKTDLSAAEIFASAPRLEMLAADILREIKTAREHGHADFSVSKLLAGLSQVASLALAFLSYLKSNEPSFTGLLLFAIWMQCLTATLFVMGRQK